MPDEMQESAPSPEGERRLALVIGVNDAPLSDLPSLHYAVNDAEAMAEVLQQQCGFTLMRPPLLGADATSANVKKAILALARQRSDNDFLLLYFSGHGQPMLVDGDQPDIYLATHDFAEGEVEEDNTLHVSMRWLQDKLYLPTQAGKVLLILDCCYAGNMGRTAPDPYLEDLKARIQKYFGAPGSASGSRSGGLRLALTATGHDQTAYERDGHGMMTGFLLDALRGQVDEVIDLEERGNVSLQRLHSYLLRVMPATQNPSVAGDYAGKACVLAQYAERAETLRQARRVTVNERPHSYIPLARSASFQPRPGEFERIATLLFEEQTDDASVHSPHACIVGLIGMGGIGKTRLAVELAYIYKERFPTGVFWLPVTSMNVGELLHQLADLVSKTDYLPPSDDVSHPENEERRARHFFHYLREHPDALLILDNVEDIGLILEMLPRIAGEEICCTILYTSRSYLGPTHIKTYTVEQLTEDGALRLLLERRSVLLARVLAGADDEEPQAARAICQYVERLPLALTLLRDLLRDEALTLVHLWGALQQRGALETTKEQEITRSRLFSTFFLSWRKVRNPDAQKLFKLATYFPEAAPIPLWLLGIAANLEGNTSLEPLGRARMELQRWSLIEVLAGDVLRLHPLIREFGRELIQHDPQGHILLESVDLQFSNAFTNINNLEQRALNKGYWQCLSDVQTALSYARLLGIEHLALLERLEYWLARESFLLGTSELWPKELPGLFYQQLYNHALEEGYTLQGAISGVCWLRQQNHVGAENQALLRELRHPDEVTWAAFSSNNRNIVTACADGIARIWDVSNGQLLRELKGHTNAVMRAIFSPDGQYIVTCSLDNTAFVWDAVSGHILQRLHGHLAGIQSVAFSPDGTKIATASEDRTARVWDRTTGEMVAYLAQHKDMLSDITFSPNGNYIATCATDGYTFLWDIASEQVVETLGEDEDMLKSATFSPDGTCIATGSNKGVQIWNISQRKVIASFAEEYFEKGYFITSVAFSPDGYYIAASSSANTAQIWNILSGETITTYLHRDILSSVSFSSNGLNVVTSSFDDTVRIWKLATTSSSNVVDTYDGEIKAIRFSSDGVLAVTATREGIIRAWNVETGEMLHGLKIDASDVWASSIALSQRGRKVVIAFFDKVWLWDSDKNRILTQVNCKLVSVHESLNVWNGVALSPDEHVVAIGTIDKDVRIWDFHLHRHVATLQGHQSDITAIYFTLDGNHIVTGSLDGTALIWDTALYTKLSLLKGHVGGVTSVGVSADSARVATGALDGTIYIWSIRNGKKQATLKKHTQAIVTLSFSPDDRILMSCDSSGQVFLW